MRFLPWILLLAACGSAHPSPPDAGADAGPVPSVCGHPGDVGNALGVGQYCQHITDCPPSAPICSSVNNDSAHPALNTFFCVLPCDPCGAPGFCGAGAACVCQGPGLCGCTPDSCSAVFPDAGPPSCDGGVTDGGTDAGH